MSCSETKAEGNSSGFQWSQSASPCPAISAFYAAGLRIWEAKCGDETGSVTLSIRSEEIAEAHVIKRDGGAGEGWCSQVCKPDASLRLQNARVWGSVCVHQDAVRLLAANTLRANRQVVMVKGYIRLNVDKWAVARLVSERF